jgi:hypothetical protein
LICGRLRPRVCLPATRQNLNAPAQRAKIPKIPISVIRAIRGSDSAHPIKNQKSKIKNRKTKNASI